MRLFLVFFAVVAAVAAGPQGRIVGGNAAASDQFPHQASVRDFENNYLCGGWIYSRKWIVSAAHCNHGRTISNTRIVVGTSSLSEGGQEYDLSRIILHPNFNSGFDHNLALLEILYELDLYPNVRPIPIATTTPERNSGLVTGWGHTQQDGQFSDNLQWIYVETLTNTQCRARFGVVEREYVTDAKICTANVEGVGMCVGDAGNALVAGNRVIGMASWGFGGCGSGYPDVYTRMSYYVPWISGIVTSV